MGPDNYGKSEELLLNAKTIVMAIRDGVDDKRWRDIRPLLIACHNMILDLAAEVRALRRELNRRKDDERV